MRRKNDKLTARYSARRGCDYFAFNRLGILQMAGDAMKTEDKDKMREALYGLVETYRSGSHAIINAVMHDPDFEYKVLKPFMDVYGWTEADQAEVEKRIKEHKQLAEEKGTTAVRMAIKILASTAVTGFAIWKFRGRKKETTEK